MADNIDYEATPQNPNTDPELPQPSTTNTSVENPAPPAAVDPNTDSEFGNLDAAQAAAAERAPDTVSPEDVQAGLDDALSNTTPTEDTEPEAYDAKSLGIEEDSWLTQKYGEVKQYINRAALKSEEALAGQSQAATIQRAKEQATLQARYNQPFNGDWRVRLTLAPGSNYLYKAQDPGILKPLADANGVIFPYTPQINTSYTANYDKYDLVHSNYRGYFYKNSSVGDINITATFTAQDTQEANYLLAVIHFFRSVTKMFYGKDAQRGAPPPMVYLTGLGNYQFNGHPCLVSSFTYNLPADVDYIRAGSSNNQGTNLDKTAAAWFGSSFGPSVGTAARAIAAGLFPGAVPQVPAFGSVFNTVNNLSQATYVPTKMEIQMTLYPVNTRNQVSQQFSVKGFANGDLLKGGFW